MRVPRATYRLQFHSGFGFRDAEALIPYLRDLGISDVYASPLFRTKPNSSSGYDVADPTQLAPELGTPEEFRSFTDELKRNEMGLLLDIVPNHMAAHPSNPWWNDVLENGPSSPYAYYFDIDWDPESRHRQEKVVWPILGAPFGEVLERAELTLAFDRGRFVLRYFDRELPLDPKTYGAILSYRLNDPSTGLDPGSTAEIVRVNELIQRMPPRTATAQAEVELRTQQSGELKEWLWRLYTTDASFHAFLDANLREFNGNAGDPRSFDPLEELLAQQVYVLSFWRVARERINYRRFFDIADLVGINAEDREVFDRTHAYVFQLAGEDRIAGVRVDHVDGLYDPQEYLNRLTECLPDRYVLVEKILCSGEALPKEWPIAGTTGYDALNAINAVTVDPGGLERLEGFYRQIAGDPQSFADCKRRVIEDLFAGESLSLSVQLNLLADMDRYAKDMSPRGQHDALMEVTACLPVYRTYTKSFEIRPPDLLVVERAVQEARDRNPKLNPGLFEFVRRMLLLQCPPSLTQGNRYAWRRFVRRWQQFSGPVMAKGVEDTAFYLNNRLISLNEVGSEQRAFSIADFHAFHEARSRNWPHSMSAGSTHDTKRSEDVRARINVLSEIPEEWIRCVTRWRRWNARCKPILEGSPVPAPNEELLIYQTLVGAWPLDPAEVEPFRARLHDCLRKSLREAKVRTSWRDPNRDYENAVARFVDAILSPTESERFFTDFQRFQERVALRGAWSSLSQTLLRLASPGVPDIYQGADLWDLSMVDPDNRRPVDFDRRRRLLEEWSDPSLGEMLKNWRNGAIKLHVIRILLGIRRQYPEVFTDGDYVPIPAEGRRADQTIAFARRAGAAWVIAVAPRFFSRFPSQKGAPAGSRAWSDTELVLPENAPTSWSNVFSGETINVTETKRLPLQAILRRFPVALLVALPE